MKIFAVLLSIIAIFAVFFSSANACSCLEGHICNCPIDVETTTAEASTADPNSCVPCGEFPDTPKNCQQSCPE